MQSNRENEEILPLVAKWEYGTTLSRLYSFFNTTKGHWLFYEHIDAIKGSLAQLETLLTKRPSLINRPVLGFMVIGSYIQRENGRKLRLDRCELCLRMGTNPNVTVHRDEPRKTLLYRFFTPQNFNKTILQFYLTYGLTNQTYQVALSYHREECQTDNIGIVDNLPQNLEFDDDYYPYMECFTWLHAAYEHYRHNRYGEAIDAYTHAEDLFEQFLQAERLPAIIRNNYQNRINSCKAYQKVCCQHRIVEVKPSACDAAVFSQEQKGDRVSPNTVVIDVAEEKSGLLHNRK